jgi:hypothetical protein
VCAPPPASRDWFNPSTAHQYFRSSEQFLGRYPDGVHATCTP